MVITLSAVGLLVGFLVGMTGVGGASLLTPILIFLGVHPITAIGTDMVYNSLTKLAGAIQHWRQRSVRWTVVMYLAAGSIPSAFMAVYLVEWANQSYGSFESIMKIVQGSILMGLAAICIVNEVISNQDKALNRWQMRTDRSKRSITILLGAVFGFVVGITSIGSGSLFVLAIYYLYSISGKELVGTDLTHAFLLTTLTGALHLGFGNVEFGIVVQLLIGSIPGVVAGSIVSSKIPTKLVKFSVLVIVFISGLMLISSEYF